MIFIHLGNNCNSVNGNNASETFYISFAIPFFAILIMNVLIIVGIKRQRKKMSKLMTPESNHTSFTDVSTVSVGKVREIEIDTKLLEN